MAATVTADVTVTFPTTGYRITDWGQPLRQDNRFIVDAVVDEFIGFAGDSITPLSHQYDLGNPGDGAYTFEFFSWGQLVKSEPFVVGSPAPIPGPESNDLDLLAGWTVASQSSDADSDDEDGDLAALDYLFKLMGDE
jgi:hypothetical protein